MCYATERYRPARDGGVGINRQARRSWDLLYLLTFRELKLRYQDTIFGFLWSLIRPLLQGAVMFVVLRKFIRIDVEDYHLVLLAGLFPWTWFQTSLLLAVGSFAGNGALIKKVYFPRFVLPLATVLNNGVQYALSIPVLVILLRHRGIQPELDVADWHPVPARGRGGADHGRRAASSRRSMSISGIWST